MTSPAISRSSSFCSSTMAQDVGDKPRVHWAEPLAREIPAREEPGEPLFLFRISPASTCSTEENGLQHLMAEPQAQSLMSKLRKCLCLGA